MKNQNTTQNITILYFNEPNKNIYAELPADKEQAKRLAKRIYKDAMQAVSEDKRKCKLLCQTFAV